MQRNSYNALLGLFYIFMAVVSVPFAYIETSHTHLGPSAVFSKVILYGAPFIYLYYGLRILRRAVAATVPMPMVWLIIHVSYVSIGIFYYVNHTDVVSAKS